MKRKSVFLIVLFLFINAFYTSACDKEQTMLNGGPDTLLHKAVKDDDIKEVKRLLTEEGWEEVIVSSNNSDILRQTGNTQVNVNLEGNYYKPPLFYVKSLKMAQFLISKGADVLAEDRYKNTPLHKVKSPAIAKLFIEKGADRHAKNDGGNTPLSRAYYFNNTKLINFYDCLDKKQPEDLSVCLK